MSKLIHHQVTEIGRQGATLRAATSQIYQPAQDPSAVAWEDPPENLNPLPRILPLHEDLEDDLILQAVKCLLDV